MPESYSSGERILKYTDRFLRALGAWQNGWREKKHRRIEIRDELLSAIAELDPSTLPVSSTPATCYRKRYLVPNNPQNGGDFWKLILDGRIEDGVASWTLNEDFSRLFKDLVRDGCVTAIFEHTPDPKEIILDIVALWNDLDFCSAVRSYSDRSAAFAEVLLGMRDKQYEIILNAPLLSKEVIDFVGCVGDAEYFYDVFGAKTEEAQDVIWKNFAEIGVYPGDLKWTGRVGAQRSINTIQTKYKEKYFIWVYNKLYKEYLNSSTHLTHPGLFRVYLSETRLIEIFNKI